MRSPYGAITFLNYEDMDAGDHFYREDLGFPLIEDQGWAKVYRIREAVHVGIVKAQRASMGGLGGPGTLLSILVGDVDDWYARLSQEPSIEILNPPAMVGELPVYSFFLKDPAGYSVEIQAFTDVETAQRFGRHI